MKSFYDAMVELVHATDENCAPVHLYRGDWTADSLRETARLFAATMASRETVHIGGPAAEAAKWENLAKLATATAAAIREGRLVDRRGIPSA